MLRQGESPVFPFPGSGEREKGARSTDLVADCSHLLLNMSGNHMLLLERILLGRPVSQDPQSPRLGVFK